MFSPLTVILTFSIYIVWLFLVGFWVERKAASGINLGNNPLIYSLSLAVFFTAWTFYGGVGVAATSGMMYLAFHIGATLVIVLSWIVLRKMIRIRNEYRITSIADIISLRYDKSPSIAALSTIIAFLGIIPYISLQLKAIFSTFDVITRPSGTAGTVDSSVGLIIIGLMILFTIIFGARRLVPTERHQGMVVALAIDSIVKLISFLAVGVFVTYYMFGGLGDIFTRFAESSASKSITSGNTNYYLTWLTNVLLTMSAFLFLPYQFHLAVVENFHEKHLRTMMWLFPLCMLLMDFFVLPIAMGGLLKGYLVAHADTFVLMLPLNTGHIWLSLLVFLGGFSAATGMVMVSSMTLSTMVTNHLVIPVLGNVKALGILKHHILQFRWLAVAAIILASYWFERRVGLYFRLADIGVISFVAILQFAPPIIGGLFWERGNKFGAFLGMITGFLLWLYVLVLPAFAYGSGALHGILAEGPWGLKMLRPEHLFGLTGLTPASHAVLWTMIFNVGFYVSASLLLKQTQEERNIAVEFVSAFAVVPIPHRLIGEQVIDKFEKISKIEELFRQFFPPSVVAQTTEQLISSLDIRNRGLISVLELAELRNGAERSLASSIGAAAAHQAILRSVVFTSEEELQLKRIFADIIAELKLTPSELISKIDYYRDRERLLTEQAKALEEKVAERDMEIAHRKRAEDALRDSQRRLADLVEFLPDATFAVDLEGRVIIWNRAAEDLTGAKAEDMLGKGDHEYSIPFYGERRPTLIDMTIEPSEEIRRLYHRFQTQGDIIIGESLTRKGNSGTAYMSGIAAPLCDSDGKIVGAIESVRDITDRKEAEAALQESEERYRVLVQYAPDGIVVFDCDQDKFVDFNRSAERLFGCSREELLRSGPVPFYSSNQPDGRSFKDSLCDNNRRALAGEEVVFERFIHNAEGKDLICEVRLVRLPSAGRRLVRGSYIDITERKHAEESRRLFEKRVEDQKHHFYTQTILSATKGKLEICDIDKIRPCVQKAHWRMIVQNAQDTVLARHEVELLLKGNGLVGNRLDSFMLGIGEALTNAYKHAQRGWLYAGASEDRVWAMVADRGKGIESLILPQVTLLGGFSTKVSMGLGYTIMLDVSDHILLKTDNHGTMVVLIKNILESQPQVSLDQLPDTWNS